MAKGQEIGQTVLIDAGSTPEVVAQWYSDLEAHQMRVEQVVESTQQSCRALRTQLNNMRKENFAHHVYSLHAIVFHRGANDRPSGGHYYVYVRDRNATTPGSEINEGGTAENERWLKFDDDKVTVCECTTLELLTKAYGGKGGVCGDPTKHDCARTLVYVQSDNDATMSDEASVMEDVLACPGMCAPGELRPEGKVVVAEQAEATKEGKVKEEDVYLKATNTVSCLKEEEEIWFGSRGVLSRCLPETCVAKRDLLEVVETAAQSFQKELGDDVRSLVV